MKNKSKYRIVLKIVILTCKIIDTIRIKDFYFDISLAQVTEKIIQNVNESE